MATVTDPLVGRLVDGRYEVVSRVARGGMATVYLAIDRRLDREVALKVMHPHLAEGISGADFVSRFRREARAAARLAHPGLVAVLDQGVDGETSYLTMEYVDGVNLRRHLAERGALSLGEALDVAEQVLDALAVAHRAGLVHRDIKPENVLVAAGRVKLADFGLARAVTEVTSTTTGTVFGTVAYLAPELVTHNATDARTDVYAIGVLLYEMLTGRQPFTGETPIHVAYQHVNSDVPAPSDRAPGLPIEVDDLVAALAARDPAERPLDAGAALALLRRTRDALDETALTLRADVAPSIALPDATGDADDATVALTGEAAAPGADGDADGSGDLTEAIATAGAGSTVALPIGTGVPDAPAEPEPSPARRRRLLVTVGVALLALLGFGAWWYASEGPGAYTAVPGGLVGVTEAEAVAVLDAHDLAHTVTERHDSVVPEGAVVAAEPGEGERVRRDGSVTLVVSLGKDLVAVPEGLVGVLQDEADRILQAADLVPAYQQEHSDTVGLGVVIEASEQPGASVERHSTVTLTISQGPEPVTVTSVVGATRAAAETQLGALGLKVAVSEDYSDTVEEGRVISQSPEATTQAHRMDTVTILVSKGPETVEMPNVVGKQFDAAAKTLTDLGLVVKRENVLGGYFGTVRSQSVERGERVPRGTEIVLTVV